MPALAVAALAAWGLGHLQRPLWPALVLALPVAAWAWWMSAPSPVLLNWDGQQWSANGRVGRLDLMIDLGPWMLLRLRPAERPRRSVWIPVAAGEAGASRHALRAAVYCQAPEPTPGARSDERGNAAKPD